MPKRNDALERDRDLDQRPFGDSHFGDPRRSPRGLGPKGPGKGRLARSVGPGDGLTDERGEASRRYAWHEGFFDDLEATSAPPDCQAVRRTHRTAPIERGTGR